MICKWLACLHLLIKLLLKILKYVQGPYLGTNSGPDKRYGKIVAYLIFA